MAVAHDRGHARHRGQFLGRALRIAAGDDNLRRGIPPVRAADEGTRGAIRLGRHAARIYDDHIGSKGFALAQRAQISRYGLAVGARRPASEVLDVKARHLF